MSMTPEKARQAVAALIAEAIPESLANEMANWKPAQWEGYIKFTMAVMPRVFEGEGIEHQELAAHVQALDRATRGDALVSGGAPLSEVELARLVMVDQGAPAEIPWQVQFIDDMRAIGVLVDYCDGCGRPDCTGCPCGSTTAVNHQALSPEASAKLKQVFAEREKKA